MKYFITLLFTVFVVAVCSAQEPDILRQLPKAGRSGGQNKTDTSKSARDNALGFEHRDDKKDSISISYKYLDSVRINRLDSSINDFDKYFSVPSSWQYLGNNGAAAYPLIYTPNLKPGWDAGFHAFDVYRYKLEDTKFYKTTKPFTQLSYQLASGKEQMIKALHTQNPRQNWNFGFDYRLISAPGFFITQNTNHKSYRLFSTYQGKRKRYAAYFVLMGNTIKNSENGGITNDSSLADPNKKKRYAIDVNLGNALNYTPNPFNASVSTGNIDKDLTFFLRQTYDIGKKDSVAVNDSTTEYLFYPKLRAQYTFTYSHYNYLFQDLSADTLIYKTWYDTVLKTQLLDTFSVHEKWSVISNDFSLLQFPDTKNSAQFLLAGARIENIRAQFYRATAIESKNYYNIILHGEYRNKTRNKLWDVLLKGEFYLNGLNSGDYKANASIDRYLNKKLGDVRLFFTNVNRSPSFIYNSLSAFNFKNATISKKENIISFGAEAHNQFVNLGFKNHLITNLAYFSDYYHTAQSTKVINLLQLFASKKIKLTKKINWYAEAVVQQTDGSAPVKVPLVFTRNRLAFEGVYYKNLNLSTGLEVRYYTPYEGYNYSPVMGQFMPQDTMKLKNLPDISAFFDFRIKSFTAYIRAENLNTVSVADGFGFTNNNFAAPHYPTQGLMIRFGIQWNFIN
ncbi:putative porin [Ferruginibacter sp. SUN106]|uniref:putative porin n=1 Tax=Ferruginibacter sp. SUN106 TaxID=2978348 RepID=UPI003D35C3AA